MRRLTTNEFWTRQHAGHVQATPSAVQDREGLRGFLDRMRLRVGALPKQTYSEFLVDRLLRRHLPVNPDWKVAEIGCAPGRFLVKLNRMFGYQPYGVEYTQVGVEATKANLKQHGLDPNNIIQADFFSPEFQEQYKQSFDVVFSGGFIEHFSDPRPAVAAHVNVLRPGGFLVCSIPNLRNMGYPFLLLFGRDLLDAHNLGIMRLKPYQGLFDGLGLEQLCCSYTGAYYLFGTAIIGKERTIRGALARSLDRVQDLLDHLMFMCLGGRSLESSWCSTLMYIGRRPE